MKECEFNKLSHTIYECIYHIVFCPKYRKKILQDDIAEYIKQQIYILYRQKDLVEVLGGGIFGLVDIVYTQQGHNLSFLK